MRERILSFLSDKGTLIQPEAVDYILTKKEPIKYVENVMANTEEPLFILTVEHLKKVDDIARSAASLASDSKVRKSEKKQKKKIEPESVSPISQISSEEKALDNFVMESTIIKEHKPPCPVQELPEEFDIIKDISGNSTCQGTIGDFKKYFNDRLKTIKKILKERREMAGVIPINRIKRAQGNFKIIGMVSDIRTTKTGNKMIILEDENSSINVLLTKDRELANDNTVMDEVLGVLCKKFRDDRPRADSNLIMAEELVRPDIPVNRTTNRSRESIYVCFVSDVHVGSKTFLKDEFNDFLDWLRGNNSKKRDVAKKVGYIVIPGDVVDGIGIYPDQEEELEIEDIYGQYEELARLIRKVPEHIKVIMLPGNHDAVRPAEPQPTFSMEIQKLFPQNVIFVGNPCYFNIHGVNILAYHGRSMDDFIKALPSLDYSKAIKIMIEMLKKRHLAPIYGGRTPIAPEHRDYLVIDKIPDIFVTGHGHSTGMKQYRGITLINASAWQSQTSFQKMHNFIPDPAKVPIFNLQTGEPSIIDFS
jgi:DNA polymerase II small subunit